jgi:hypothetical protein
MLFTLYQIHDTLAVYEAQKKGLFPYASHFSLSHREALILVMHSLAHLMISRHPSHHSPVLVI